MGLEGAVRVMGQDTTPILFCDACVMLDYLEFAPRILSLTVKHLTQIYIPDVVLLELSKYSQSDIESLGIQIQETPLSYYLLPLLGPLSLQDRACLMLSQEMGWTCVTNDQKLRKACDYEQVATLGGFGLLILLVRKKIITREEGIQIIKAIGKGNKWISPSLIETVISQLEATKK
ncbi:MAG: hypothetical protein WBI82_14420 [Sphaerochaeta sp.]